MRLARGLNDFLLGCLQPAVADIVEQAAVEQVGILWDQAQLRVQRFLRHGADVHAVDEDLSVLGVVQAQDEAHERGLTRARIPHQADALSGGDGDVQVAEDRLAGRIREGDVAKIDPPPRDAHRRSPWRIDDIVRPHDRVHAVGDVAYVLEEFKEAPAQVARLVDDQQRGRGGDDKFRYRDLTSFPQPQGEVDDGDLQHRGRRVLKPADALRVPAGLAHRAQLPAQLLVQVLAFEAQARE